jgi:hypothetical protein
LPLSPSTATSAVVATAAAAAIAAAAVAVAAVIGVVIVGGISTVDATYQYWLLPRSQHDVPECNLVIRYY